MTTESPDRKDLESKDKESLVAIAKPMGGKPTSGQQNQILWT